MIFLTSIYFFSHQNDDIELKITSLFLGIIVSVKNGQKNNSMQFLDEKCTNVNVNTINHNQLLFVNK